MGKALIIAEKPSVAREIAAVLGSCVAGPNGVLENDHVVISNAIGHLVTIECIEAETTGKDFTTLPVIPDAFTLKTIDKTRSQFTVLKGLMSRSDVDVIVNACDAGREGELIFRYIMDIGGIQKPVKRLWMQSMTNQAIIDAWEKLRSDEEMRPLADAAKCRRESDWLVGINATKNAPLDVFPEFAPPLVEVQTEAPGLSTEEVDAIVTVPLENSLNGLPFLKTLRSKSVLGLSSVVMIFDTGTDILKARQLVQERLNLAQNRLPAVVKPPVLMAPFAQSPNPASSGCHRPRPWASVLRIQSGVSG